MLLTASQRAILHFVRNYTRTVGYPPTVREIADGVKLRSASTVHHHLRVLHTLGFIRRDPSVPRGLVILSDSESDD